MGQVTITLNGRTYRLRCGEGEEQRLIELADMVRDKLTPLVREFGQAGDDRLLLMTALLMADELLDTRARLAALSDAASPSQMRQPQTQPQQMPQHSEPPVSARAPGGRTPRAERQRSAGGSASSEPPPLPHATPMGASD